MKIYLEFKDDKSEKFWEVSVDGNTHTVRYGKIGANGTSKTKEFDTAEKAEADAQKLANAKKKKGYEELGQANKSAAPSSSKPTFKKMDFEDWQELGNDFMTEDADVVLYYKGDLHIKENFDVDWLDDIFTSQDMFLDDCLIHIDGNLTVDGNVFLYSEDENIDLLVSGNLKCTQISSGNETIVIDGSADIKNVLIGNGNDGHIEIYGTTKVPYVLNNEHSINIQASKETIIISEIDDDGLMEYDFIDEDYDDAFKSSIIEDGEIDFGKFIEMVDKGESPLLDTAISRRQKDKNNDENTVQVCSSDDKLGVLTDKDVTLKELKKIKGEQKYLEITKLELYDNSLRKIPDEVYKLKNLVELSLSDNKIKEIDPRLYTLKKIKEIDFSDNNISSFDGIHQLEDLIRLDLSSNNITAIPGDIYKLKNLKYLNVKSCQLSISEIERFIEKRPDVSLICTPVDFPDAESKEKLIQIRKALEDTNYAKMGIEATNVISEKLKELDKLFSIAELTFEELIPVDFPDYPYYTSLGCDSKELILSIGNEIAWRASLLETDPERIKKAVEYAERTVAKITSHTYDYILDSYVRILIKAGRINDAYKIVNEVLTRDPEFDDFKDIIKKQDYKAWVLKNK